MLPLSHSPEPGTAAGHQLCSQHWDSPSTLCTQCQLELQLHFGVPSNSTKHEMCFTCWVQPQEHGHNSSLLLLSLPRCVPFALQARSSPVCFCSALTDLSSGLPHQFLASCVHNCSSLWNRHLMTSRTDSGKSAFCSHFVPSVEQSTWLGSGQLSWMSGAHSAVHRPHMEEY